MGERVWQKESYNNTVESCHAVIKVYARRSNMLRGQPAKRPDFLCKLQDLAFRFSNRSLSHDLFVCFLFFVALFQRFRDPKQLLASL